MFRHSSRPVASVSNGRNRGQQWHRAVVGPALRCLFPLRSSRSIPRLATTLRHRAGLRVQTAWLPWMVGCPLCAAATGLLTCGECCVPAATARVHGGDTGTKYDMGSGETVSRRLGAVGGSEGRTWRARRDRGPRPGPGGLFCGLFCGFRFWWTRRGR
jgi:hypothetical protein